MSDDENISSLVLILETVNEIWVYITVFVLRIYQDTRIPILNFSCHNLELLNYISKTSSFLDFPALT